MPEEAPKARYLALDPGDTIGWATFDENGRELSMGQFRYEKFLQEIEDLLTSELTHVIIEDYRNYGHKQQKRWSNNNTSKVIGKIELLCELRGVPFTKQMANCYGIGAKWGGFEIPSNHSISHQFVAIAHGIYWLQKNNVRAVGMNLLNRNNND